MKKQNCWDVLKCGREQGGEKAKILGICPATMKSQFDSINNGEHSGRFCWVVAGTYCDGEVSGTRATKLFDCIECDFFKQVSKEEAREFIINPIKEKK